MEHGNQLEDTKKNIDKTHLLKREELLKYKEKTQRNNIPFITTYSRQMPNLKRIVDSSWNTLMINPAIATKFPQKPLFCYHRNRNLRLIRTNENQQKQSRQEKGKVNWQMFPLLKKTRHKMLQAHCFNINISKQNW